jgi:hypothetical protein
MTHITIEKAKLEQWLEAFEICVDCRPIGTETMTQTRESKVLHGLKTIKAALAQTAQEPDNGDELTIAYMSGVHRGKELAAQPAQRPWVGLTIEEIAACCMESTTTQFEFAQAIEAKLKELNT